jgi:hypothetical protein
MSQQRGDTALADSYAGGHIVMKTVRHLKLFSESSHVRPTFEVDGTEHRIYRGFRPEEGSGIVNLTWTGGPCPCSALPTADERPAPETIAAIG